MIDQKPDIRKKETIKLIISTILIICGVLFVIFVITPKMTQTNQLLNDASTLKFDTLRDDVIFSNKDDAGAVDVYHLSFDNGVIFVNKNSEKYETVYKNANDTTIEFKTPQGQTITAEMEPHQREQTNIKLKINENTTIILTAQ